MTTTTTISPSHRLAGRWLPALSLLVAGGAAALGVVAITTDDVTQQPAQIVVDQPAHIPANVIEPPDVRDVVGPVACAGQARLPMPCAE